MFRRKLKSRNSWQIIFAVCMIYILLLQKRRKKNEEEKAHE